MPTARIVCIGDTLVKGEDSVLAGARTFRGRLWQLLVDANYDRDLQGTQIDTPAVGGDPDHEGYAGAFIDSTGHATNNIASKVSTIVPAGANVVVILLVGWEDVLANTPSIGTKYGALVDAILTQNAAAKVFICTLPPYYNKTEAETGTTYAAYATLNTAIRAKANGTSIFAIDLAALAAGGSTSERTAFVERLLAESVRQSDSLVAMGGRAYSDPYAGTRFVDWASIQAIAAAHGPPGTGRQGFPGSSYQAESLGYGFPHFLANASQAMVWVHAFPGPGNTATNTGAEIRNVAFGVLKTDGTYVWLFSGARISGWFWNGTGFFDPPTSVPPGCVFRQQPDGISTFWRSALDGAYSPEGWQADRVPSAGPALQTEPYKGINRSAIANAAAFICVFQARLVLDNPSGTNDIAQARYLVRAGFDLQTVDSSGNRIPPPGGTTARYDFWGFPCGALDVGGGRNATLDTPTLTQFGFITMQGAGFPAGLERPFYSNWTDSPYMKAPYGRTEAQIRANPPPLPPFWTFTAGSSGFPSTDYAGTTYKLAQGGADRIAQRMVDAMVASGVMAAYVIDSSGGTTPVLAVGASISPRYADQKIQPGNTLYTYADVAAAVTAGPVWSTAALPFAAVGVAYAAQLSAGGSPAATYSIISGAPGWLSCSSTGVLSGTPTGGEASHTIVFRATNASGSADVTLTLRTGTQPNITTTTLPNAAQSQAYFEQLNATGSFPFTWSVVSGTLPAGLQLSASGAIFGTPTSTGTSSFTAQASNGFGVADTQALSLTVGVAANQPAITTTSLPSGTVGAAYSQTVAATGAATITFSIVEGALPTGLAMSSAGAITGTPTVAGYYAFKVRAANAFTPAAERELAINIVPAGAVTTTGGWSKWITR